PVAGAPRSGVRSRGMVPLSRATRTPQPERAGRTPCAQSGSRPMSTANALPLWQPDPERIARARITEFQSWAARHHGAPAEGGYADLPRWSVEERETFWAAVAQWFAVRSSPPPDGVLDVRSMPGARWFPGATLNY